jgi:hypothetical protein
MSIPPDLALNKQLGLLRAVCERNEYLGPDEVEDQEVPLAIAKERYGEKGVPQPGSVIYQYWGKQPIMAGLLSQPSTSAALPYIRCAAVAQQSLGTKGVDMLVLLIGPNGSFRDEEWIKAAAAIEDDDRICRKLVWLPNDDATASAENLLSRSPFSRPWRGALPIDAQAGTIEKLISDDALDDIALTADATNLSAAEFLRQALSASYTE